MKYSFDTIRSRFVMIICILFVILFPIMFWGLLRTPTLQNNIPDFLYQNNWLPFLLFFLIPAVLIYYKRTLFWKRMSITIDKAQAAMVIDGKKYALNNLKYYELERGSMFTAGDSRLITLLKFRGHRTIAILPCWSSESISEYDAFFEDFLELTDRYFPENKERLLNKPLKYGLITFMVLSQIVFIYFLFIYGKAAAKMAPGLLVMYGVFLPQIFKRKSKRKKTTLS